jgi:hypothetical protein
LYFDAAGHSSAQLSPGYSRLRSHPGDVHFGEMVDVEQRCCWIGGEVLLVQLASQNAVGRRDGRDGKDAHGYRQRHRRKPALTQNDILGDFPPPRRDDHGR